MSVSRRHGGLGLGLAIARQLVGAHAGTIALHSDGPGRGSAAVVRLPVMQAATSADLEPTFRMVRLARPAWKGGRGGLTCRGHCQ